MAGNTTTSRCGTSPSTTSRRRRPLPIQASIRTAPCLCPLRPTRIRLRSTSNGGQPAAAHGSRSRATPRAPWGTSLDTTALADGLYDFRAIATDATGHTGTSLIRANVRVDSTSPAGSLTSPAARCHGRRPERHAQRLLPDAGSGIASVALRASPHRRRFVDDHRHLDERTVQCHVGRHDGCVREHDLQPVLTDRAGNTFTGAMRTITVDVSAPTVVLANPGATISGSVTLNATVTGSGQRRSHSQPRPQARVLVVGRHRTRARRERDLQHVAAAGRRLRHPRHGLRQPRQHLVRHRHLDPRGQHRAARRLLDAGGRLDRELRERDRTGDQRAARRRSTSRSTVAQRWRRS